MLDQWMLEVIGYVASVLVAISLMMSSILRLRVINLMGAAAFTVYGLLIQAYPVAAVNAFIILINVYYLRGMLRTQEYFRLLEIPADSDYLRYFLAFYREEIHQFVPDFSEDEGGSRLALFILRDLVPAGLLLGEVEGQTLRVELDFVIPQYRDFKIGRYLFKEEAEFFLSRGVSEIVSAPGSVEHAAYLEKMGFQPAPSSSSDEREYRLSIG